MNQTLNNFHVELQSIYSRLEIDTLAYWVLEELTGMSRAQLLSRRDLRLSEEQSLLAGQYLDRLKRHEPIQYILGKSDFFALPFVVNSAVLIPRPETEELVEWILQDWKDNVQFKLLDIGTGSGCIPISIKHHRKHAVVEAIDYSHEALQVAEQNAALNQVEMKIIHDDILNPRETYTTFDVIVSNPPYIPKQEQKAMDLNVSNFEPQLALFVEDNDPLVFYKAIAHFASVHLNHGGALYFETHYQFAGEVKIMMEEMGFQDVVVRKDLSGNERMVRGINSKGVVN